MNYADQAVLDTLSRELDAIEQNITPMVDSYARVEPRIIEKNEAGIRFRFIVYHKESSSWFDNADIDTAIVATTKLALVHQDDVIFDLGCNSGYHSAWFGIQVPYGHVHAFDPFPWNTAATRAQAAINGLKNVTAHTVGLGKAKAEIETDATSSKTFNPDAPRENYKIKINIEPPRAYLRYNPTFLKIDIEGAEHDLVQTNLMSHWSVQRGYVEMHPKFIRAGGGNPSDFLNHLSSAGFKIKDHRLALVDKFEKVDETSYFFERLKRKASFLDRLKSFWSF